MKASPVPTAQVIRARAAAEFSHGHGMMLPVPSDVRPRPEFWSAAN
jgi:hypothetical protein